MSHEIISHEQAEWEYGKLITFDVIDKGDRSYTSAFVNYTGDPKWQTLPNDEDALGELAKQGWQVITSTSSNHLDGTLQQTFYLRRSIGDAK